MNFIRIFCILFIALCTTSCTADEVVSLDELYGEYSYIEGYDYFLEFMLEEGGAFTTFIHENPGVSGRWHIEGSNLILDVNPEKRIKLKIVELNKSQAVFHFSGAPTSTVYERTYDYLNFK